MAFDTSLLSSVPYSYEIAYWNDKMEMTTKKAFKCSKFGDTTKQYVQFVEGMQGEKIDLVICTDYGYDYQVQQYILFRDKWHEIVSIQVSSKKVSKASYEFNYFADDYYLLALREKNVDFDLNEADNNNKSEWGW